MSRVVIAWSLLIGAALAPSCGGTVDGERDSQAAGGSGAAAGAGGVPSFGGFAGSAGFSGGGQAGAPFDAGGSPSVDSGPDGYIDPGCPDAEPLLPVQECDPFAEESGCLPSDGCYPFVSYPAGACAQEQYGTVCSLEGTGLQGDPCGNQRCAGGFSCVITGAGTQCVQLCPLVGDDGCPPGLFCVPIDVEGFGACF